MRAQSSGRTVVSIHNWQDGRRGDRLGRVRVVRCPICRAEVSLEDGPHRPFCSERCRLLDLSAWASERYRIPGDPVADGPETGEDEPV
jgi:hypothetical protein